MRLPSLLLVVALLAGAGISNSHAAMSKVSVSARVADGSTKQERDKEREKTQSGDKKKDDKPKAETEARKIIATIRNLAKEAYPNAVMKYFFVGTSAGEPGIRILEEGEVPAALAAGASIEVETPAQQFTFTPAHTTSKKGEPTKHIDAKGEKQTSFAVQVVSDGEVIGAFYSASDVQAVVEKKPAAK